MSSDEAPPAYEDIEIVEDSGPQEVIHGTVISEAPTYTTMVGDGNQMLNNQPQQQQQEPQYVPGVVVIDQPMIGFYENLIFCCSLPFLYFLNLYG